MQLYWIHTRCLNDDSKRMWMHFWQGTFFYLGTALHCTRHCILSMLTAVLNVVFWLQFTIGTTRFEDDANWPFWLELLPFFNTSYNYLLIIFFTLFFCYRHWIFNHGRVSSCYKRNGDSSSVIYRKSLILKTIKASAAILSYWVIIKSLFTNRIVFSWVEIKWIKWIQGLNYGYLIR